MKPKYLLFSLSFCLFFFGCNKEKENPEPVPTPPPAVKVKYLQKVYIGNQLWEQYTWNEENKLIKADIQGPHTYKFIYDKDGYLDSIYYSSYFGKYIGKFYNSLTKISKMEFKSIDSEYTQQYPHTIEYTYSQEGKPVNIDFTFIWFNRNEQKIKMSFDWERNNISNMIDGPSGKSVIYNAYDSKINPYRLFPQILLPNLLDNEFYNNFTFFIASENNYILVNGIVEYKYDYDADGYPVLMYIKENGEWKRFKRYEYM